MSAHITVEMTAIAAVPVAYINGLPKPKIVGAPAREGVKSSAT